MRGVDLDDVDDIVCASFSVMLMMLGACARARFSLCYLCLDVACVRAFMFSMVLMMRGVCVWASLHFLFNVRCANVEGFVSLYG